MNSILSRRNFGKLSLGGALIWGTSMRVLGQAVPKPMTNGWLKLPTVPYKGKQDDIYFVDPDTGFFGNGEGKLYRTDDGGKSWSKIWDKPGTFIRALGFIDKNIGFLGNVGTEYYPGVTDTQPLYSTNDGGKSWTAISATGIEKVAGICGIHILPVRRIYQGEMRTSHIIHAAGRVGGPAAILRSEDSGAIWRVIDLSAQAGMILDINFLNAKTGFVAASAPSETGEGEAMILRTSDGGKNWVPVYKSGRPMENCWKMSWPTQQIGYATVQSYDPDPEKIQKVIIKTTNAGKSWREIPLIKNKAAQEFGIGFADANHGWVGTRTGGYETRDGGMNWAPIEFGIAVNKIRIVNKPGGGKAAFAIGVDVHRLDFMT